MWINNIEIDVDNCNVIIDFFNHIHQVVNNKIRVGLQILVCFKTDSTDIYE